MKRGYFDLIPSWQNQATDIWLFNMNNFEMFILQILLAIFEKRTMSAGILAFKAKETLLLSIMELVGVTKVTLVDEDFSSPKDKTLHDAPSLAMFLTKLKV